MDEIERLIDLIPELPSHSSVTPTFHFVQPCVNAWHRITINRVDDKVRHQLQPVFVNLIQNRLVPCFADLRSQILEMFDR